jgi:hypothetical protein
MLLIIPNSCIHKQKASKQGVYFYIHFMQHFACFIVETRLFNKSSKEKKYFPLFKMDRVLNGFIPESGVVKDLNERFRLKRCRYQEFSAIILWFHLMLKYHNDIPALSAAVDNGDNGNAERPIVMMPTLGADIFSRQFHADNN